MHARLVEDSRPGRPAASTSNVSGALLTACLGDEQYEAGAKACRRTAVLEAIIQPEDVADAAWWLGAGAAKTTGEVILLDAGLRLSRA